MEAPPFPAKGRAGAPTKQQGVYVSPVTPLGPSAAKPLPPTPPCAACAATPAITRFVTVREVAEALDCSENHVRRLLADGSLPYLDISIRGAKVRRPKIRIPATRVEAYLEAQLRTAPKAVSA
jgi:excisionase family DNA binding protein